MPNGGQFDRDREIVGNVQVGSRTEQCPECEFSWVVGQLEAHADGCRRHFKADIDNRFTYHRPTAQMVENFEILRAESRQLAIQIMLRVPEGRERSVAVRKLEEAVMWANAGIARKS